MFTAEIGLKVPHIAFELHQLRGCAAQMRQRRVTPSDPANGAAA